MKITLSLLFSFFVPIVLTYAYSHEIPDNANKSILSVKKSLTIIGKIVDEETQIPLEYGTVMLYSSEDSMSITGGFSDEYGDFSIETEVAGFFLEIGYMAYETKTIHKIELTDNQKILNLGIIGLLPSVMMLEGVEVRAEKSSVMMSLDKRVFNVGKDLVSEGGTAEDILRNVPGVWVDINGNIRLRSSGNARVLLNGQPSLLINEDNPDGLRQIQASDIERIEIITNPSARYEAEGMAGIINVVLKKNDNKGFNGSISSNIGHPNNFGLGVNMNYRKKKINFFAGAGVWHTSRPGEGSYRNRFFDLANPDSTLFSNMDRTHERKGFPVNLKIGSDYFINPKNTLTTSIYYRGNKDKNISELIYSDAYGQIDNTHLKTIRNENENGSEHNLNTFLRHRKSFSEKEHQLTTDIRYEMGKETESSIYDETYFDANNVLIDTFDFDQITGNDSRNTLFNIKSDYVLPLGEESKFEGGFQSSFRKILSDYSVRQIINEREIPDTNLTNKFDYQEIIHALYANYGNKINKFSFQFGARVEYSDIASDLNVENGTNVSKYINLFPSAFIGYDLPNDNGIQLSYSRRIERPTFLDLTPFFTLRDRRNIWRGNPNIRPEFTHVFELGYIKYWDKGTLSASAYYQTTKDVIKRIQRLDDRFPETTITQAENLRIKQNYGVEFTYSFTLAKWWRINGDINVFHSFSEGTYQYQGQEFFVGGRSFSSRSKTISRFTFWKKLNTQITFNSSAPRRTTQGMNKATLALDLATSIDILKKNGTVTLSISDLFNSRRRRSYSEDETFYSEDNFLWQSRAIVLSFHYRLNQHKKQSQIYSSPIKEDNEEQF